MPTHSGRWPAGTPAWIDLTLDDAVRAKDFYRALFGWEFLDGGEPAGLPATATRQGRSVAGLAAMVPGQLAAVWTTYLASDDAVATVAAASAAGAQVVLEATPVGDLGSVALLLDPTGASVGVWQGGRNSGTELVNEPGAVVWNEAISSDPSAAVDFYTSVFGLSASKIDGMDYWTLDLDGRPTGGVGGPDGAGSGPSHWRTYFHTDDVDATLRRAADLGGTLLGDTHDSPFGRMGGLRGPEGERFWVINPPDWS